MNYDAETIASALSAALACVLAIEEDANGNRLITGPSGPPVAEVVHDLLKDFVKLSGREQKGEARS